MGSPSYVMVRSEHCEACRADAPLLPILRCSACGASVCGFCRHAGYCAACAIVVLGEVLRGTRRVPATLSGRRILRLVLEGGPDPARDLSLSEACFVVRSPHTREVEYDRALGPEVVTALMERAGVVCIEQPVLAPFGASLEAVRPGEASARSLVCAWFVPAASGVEVRVRPVVADALPAAPCGPSQPGFLPVPLPLAAWRPAPARWIERPTALACPHCHSPARRFRDLGNALVCPSCHRSFAG